MAFADVPVRGKKNEMRRGDGKVGEKGKEVEKNINKHMK